MASQFLYQATFEERLVYLSLALTYPVYFLGGLYVLGSVLGWALFGLFLFRVYLIGRERFGDHLWLKVSPVVWLWIIGMGFMLVALLTAHIDRQLGTGQTIKSTIGWAKGWALLALFPLLGNLINIRPEIITRGVCIAAFGAVPFAIVSIVFYGAGLSGDLFMSPFKAIGGPTEVFNVRLFGINPETGMARWQFIGPWAPAAGLLSCFYLIICLQEKDRKWRRRGVLGAFTMCLLCQSRAGWVIFMAIVPIMIAINQTKYSWSWIALGVLFPTLVLLGQPVYEWVMDSYTQIKESRPGSTRVRNTLARLALQRWEHEAPIWGHGVVERGPKIVEHMPIGTHHTWYGLLFVKGIVGLFALAVPLVFTCLVMLLIAHTSRIALTGAAICVIILSYSFFENLEILAYVYWPALLWLGVSLNPHWYSPRDPKS